MKILVATDGSRAAVAALRFAARLATRDRESQLIVLTIGASPDGSPLHHFEPSPSEQRPALKRALARKILDAAASQLRRGSVRAQFRFVEPPGQTPVPDTIAREADRLKADLVVVGSEGRDTLSEWVLGGVALRLIYLARRPVAVVRAPRRRRRP